MNQEHAEELLQKIYQKTTEMMCLMVELQAPLDQLDSKKLLKSFREAKGEIEELRAKVKKKIHKMKSEGKFVNFDEE